MQSTQPSTKGSSPASPRTTYGPRAGPSKGSDPSLPASPAPPSGVNAALTPDGGAGEAGREGSEPFDGPARGPYVVRGDAGELPLVEGCVDCIVTSPPYNVGVAYDGVSDLRPLAEYYAKAFAWAREMARVL